MSKKILNEELKRMKALSGLIIENDQEEYIKKQLQRVGEEPTPEEMANITAAMQKSEGALEEAIEGGLTYDELPEKVKDYFRRNITMSVAFVKKDGSVRHMAFRRNLKSYEKSDKEKSEKQSNVLINNNLMNVYDTNSFIRLKRETGDAAQAAKGSFRNFKLDNVLAFLVGGQLFDMRDQNQIKERFGEEVYASLTPSMISSLKSDEAKGSEEIPPYEGPENPMDNQVTEVMIQEGELGMAITRILKEEMLKETVDDLIDTYTHFAIDKSTGEIMDGWEYEDLEPSDIKYYTTMDLKDNFPERRLSEFKIVTRKSLEKQGIDPYDTNNWYKIQ
jgi:hypothetical protein